MDSEIVHSSSVFKTGNGSANYRTVYRCEECKKTFKKFIIFEGHFTFNTKCRAKYGWLMQCYICGEIFRHLAELKYHIQKHTVAKQSQSKRIDQYEESNHGLKCCVCQRRFRNKFYLNEHLTKHYEQRATKSFQINGDTSSSTENSHQTASPSFQCQLCNVYCKDKTGLETHMQIHKQKIFNCEKCNLQFPTVISLAWHRKLIHLDGSTKVVEENQPNQQSQNECTSCNANGTKMSLAKNHLVTKDQETVLEHVVEEVAITKKLPQKYRCLFCKKICTTDSNLKQHEAIHSGPFKCKLCKIPFTSNALRLHVCNQSSETKKVNVQARQKTNSQPGRKYLRCDKCKFVAHCHSRLMLHKRVHYGRFECKICKIPFTRVSLVSHERRYHPELRRKRAILKIRREKALQNGDTSGNEAKTSDEAKLHQCKLCRKKFSCPAHLKRHEPVHKGAFRCDGCDIRFTHLALKIHEKQCKQFLNMNDTSVKYPCKICKLECYTAEKLAQHKTVHTTSAGYECKVCKRVFSQLSHLRRHQPYHDGTHKCKVCNAPFKLKHLSWHEMRCKSKQFINTVLFKCKVCKIICNSQKTLERHMTIHTSTNYRCRICQKKFSRMAFASHKIRCKREELTTNASEILKLLSKCDEPTINTPQPKIILNEVIFKCEKCDRSFKRNQDLQTHMRIHKIKRRYLCKVCNEISDDKIDFKNHIETHSFECYVCKNDFSSVKCVTSHIKKHVVFEQWVDSLNVYLSNWSPEKSRDILQNQPLVLVENLNVNSIYLRNFGQANLLDNCEIGIDHSNMDDTELPGSTDILTDLPNSIEENNEDTDYQKSDVIPKLEKFEPLPIHTDDDDYLVTSDDCIIYVPSESEELPIIKQQPDTTAFVSDNFSEDPIEVSSESEIDEMELYHCYFCNNTFRSLAGLGIHSKTCSFAP